MSVEHSWARRAGQTILATLALGCGASHPQGLAPPLVSCVPLFRERVVSAGGLRREGRLLDASDLLAKAARGCPELRGEADEARLEILRSLGADEQARELAREIETASPPHARARRAAAEVLAMPPRAFTRGDLEAADQLRAAGNLEAAALGYQATLEKHPRDAWAFGALGATLASLGRAASAREAYDRAIVASRGEPVVAVFAPRARTAELTRGTLWPGGEDVGLLSRGRYVDSRVGPLVTHSPTQVVVFGGDAAPIVAKAGGYGARSLDGARDARAAGISPDGKYLVLAGAKIELFELASGQRVATRAPSGMEPAASVRFAGPTRVAIGGAVFSLPELEPKYRLSNDSRVYATAIVEVASRNAPDPRDVHLVVRSVDDGATLFEVDLHAAASETLTGAHPTRPIVGWIDGSTSGIVDLHTKKVSRFRYVFPPKTWPAELRFTEDGRNACIFGVRWTAAVEQAGKDSICVPHGDLAVAVSVPPLPGAVRTGFDLQEAAPDGALVAYHVIPAGGGGLVRVVDVARRAVIRQIPAGSGPYRFVSASVLEIDDGGPRYHDARTGAEVAKPRLLADRPADGPGARFPPRARPLEPTSVHGWLGALGIVHAGRTSACFSPALDPRPQAERCGSESSPLSVLNGQVGIPGRPSPLELSPAVRDGRAFVEADRSGVDVLFVVREGMGQVFSLESGERIATLVAAGPATMVSFPTNGSVVDLVIDDDAALAPRDGATDEPSAFCLVGAVVLPLEACGSRARIRHARQSKPGSPPG